MKNFNHRFNAMLIAFAFFIVLLFLVTNIADNRVNKNKSLVEESETLFLSADPKSNLDIYYNVRDSILKINSWRSQRILGRGSNVNTFVFGIKEISECDSCYSNDNKKFHAEYKNKFFIQFNGFILNNDAHFYIDKDKYFIESTDFDNPEKFKQTKEITVRYSPGYPPSYNFSAVLIPISKKTYEILKIIVWGSLIVSALILLYLTFVLPAKVLITVASGEPFTKKNIKRLNITGLTLLAVAIIPSLISISIDWVLNKRIPDEIYFPFIQSIFDNKFTLIAGLIVLLIAKAFKQGYILQEEEDLTV